MAVRAIPAGTIGIPLNPVPEFDAPPEGTRLELFPDDREAILEVVGRSEKRLAEALHASELAVSGDISEETIHALRLLAIDNLVDIVQLRESLQETEALNTTLRAELTMWRARAIDAEAARQVEAEEGMRRERELITVLHREITNNYDLIEELETVRRPWWRRRRAAPRTLSAVA